MVEFGEKIKQLREEKGMTQQTMADRLYVTRQAVSRWECGARYPDLLTTKKIAEILGVAIDELVSGEELKKNVEQEQVLTTVIPNFVQCIIYLIGTFSYLLMCIFSAFSLIPNPKLAGTVAGIIGALDIATISGYVVHFSILLAGLCAAVKNCLSPMKIGVIMSVSYGMRLLQFLVTYVDMRIKNNGVISGWGFLEPIGLLIAGVIIGFYFCMGKRVNRILVFAVYSIGFVEMLRLAYTLKIKMLCITDLGFVLTTVQIFGKGCLIILLVYQAYILERKRKMAIK